MTLRIAFCADKKQDAGRAYGTGCGDHIAVVMTMVSTSVKAHLRSRSRQFDVLGTNVSIVMPGNSGRHGGAARIHHTENHAQDSDVLIGKECPSRPRRRPSVVGAAPAARPIHGNANGSPNEMRGAAEDHSSCESLAAGGGRFLFAAGDSMLRPRYVSLRALGREAVSGPRPHWPDDRVKNIPFRVIGVSAAKGRTWWARTKIPRHRCLLMPRNAYRARRSNRFNENRTVFACEVFRMIIQAATILMIAHGSPSHRGT